MIISSQPPACLGNAADLEILADENPRDCAVLYKRRRAFFLVLTKMTAASGLEGLRFSIISLITSKGACFGGRSSRVLFCALASPSWGIALGLVRPGPTLPALPAASRAACCDGHLTMDPLHATIEEFAAEGFSHVECYSPDRLVGFLASRLDLPSRSFQHGCVVPSVA